MKKIKNVAASAVPAGEVRQNFEVATAPLGLRLPVDGMSRWEQLAPFMPVSREKFRQLVNAGMAPLAHRLSSRCTMYSNREIHKYFADPVNYRAELK